MNSQRSYSLRRRLLVSASLLLLVFLGAMGWALNRAFFDSVLSNAEDSLRNQVLLLMGNIDVDGGKIIVPDALSEPRLTQAESTLYAQISTPTDGVLWRSPSLLENELPNMPSAQGVFTFHPRAAWQGDAQIYQLSFDAVWESETGDLPFTVQVAEHRQGYLERMRKYREKVVLWLSVMGLSVLVLLVALLSWVLKPLTKVIRQVGEIEEGRRQQFDEDYPLEVSRLTHNLNQLLEFEQQRIDRHKNTLGNLAHSLKTPLAVMSGLVYSQGNEQEARRQLSAMQDIIDYQLQSASAIGRRRFARPIDVVKPTQQIISSLQKLHRDKHLDIQLNVAAGSQFFGDQGDWLDLVGNLLENACKWASSTVHVTVHNQAVEGQTDSHRSAISLEVADDGAGIENALKASILQRGVRLDTQAPGHGLGLHIVKGIVEAYEGELSISDNTPSGAVFCVILN